MTAAVNRGDNETAEAILIANPEFLEPHASGLYGTPLHQAAASGDKKVLQFLLARGANVNSTDAAGRTPLVFAVETRQVGFPASLDIAQVLVSNGAEISHRETIGGSTALHTAARLGRLDMVKLLVAAGADIHAKDAYGNTPLHIASQEYGDRLCDYPGVVKFFIDSGTDVNSRDAYGNTPLHIVAGFGPVNVAEVLIASGAEINAKNNLAWTPLHMLAGVRASSHVRADQSNQRMAELLIAKGAEINARDNDGFTPLHRVNTIGWKSLAACLRKHGGIE